MSAQEMLVQGGRFYRMLVYAVLLLMLNVVHGIDYDAFRNDKEPKMIMRRNNRPLRRVLENELSGTSGYQKTYTVQEGTEVVLHFGTLLRFQILDIFGSLIFEHYEDFNLHQVEALFRVYDETMKRKYNIFEIVPSVLKHRDLKPSSLCRYIHLHVKTCLKESAKNCMTLRKHDQAKLRQQFVAALNYTDYVYEEGRLREVYPDVFFMDIAIRHLQQGMLTLNDRLVAGFLNNIQYDEYNERIREAEKQTVRHLLSSRHGTRKNNTRRSLSAFQIGRFYTIAPLIRYYLQMNWHTFPDPIAHQVHFLADHVIKHVGSINPNIELLGTVYEGNVLHLKYLFDLVVPSDTVDPDVANAKDYLLRKVTALKIVDKFLRIEKYQQSGPEQLFMETMQQLKDIGFARDIAMSLYVHAQFWHRSVVIENLKNLLLLFDAYENLRTVAEHKRFMIIIDSIREHLWNAKNVTIDIICNNPRACLRLGLEVVLKCDLVSVEIKNWILLYFDFVNERGSLLLVVCNGPRENMTSAASTSTTSTSAASTSAASTSAASTSAASTSAASTSTTSTSLATTKSATSMTTITTAKVTKATTQLSTVTTESEEIVPEVETTSAAAFTTTTEPAEETTVVTALTTEISTTAPTVTITTEPISTTTTSNSSGVITSNSSPVTVLNSSIVATSNSSAVTTLTTTELAITETITTAKPTTEPPSTETATLPESTTYDQHMTHYNTTQPTTVEPAASEQATTITVPMTDGTETTSSINSTTTEQINPTIALTTVSTASSNSPLIAVNKTSESIYLETTTLAERTSETTQESSEASSEELTSNSRQSNDRSIGSSRLEKIVESCDNEECSTESISVTTRPSRPAEVTSVPSGISKVIKIDHSMPKPLIHNLSKEAMTVTKASCEDSENCSDECSDENCSGSCIGPNCAGGCIGPNCSAECSGENCRPCDNCDTEESKNCVGPQCQPPEVGCSGDDCDADSSSEECPDGENCQNESTSCSGEDCSRSESVECTNDDCKKIPASAQTNRNAGGSKKTDVVVVCHNRDPHHQRKKERMQKMQQEIAGLTSALSSHSLIPVNITDNDDKKQSVVQPLTKPVQFPPVFDPWYSSGIHQGRPLYPPYPPMGHPSSFYSDITGNTNKNQNKNTNINQNWNYIQVRRHQAHDAPEMQEQNKSPVRVPHDLDSYPDM